MTIIKKKDTNIEANRAERHRMMLEDSLYKVIPLIAIPMIISMLIDSLYNLADTFFVSQIGTAATAAVGVNDALLHIFRSICFGFAMGSVSSISRLLGAKKEDEASRVATTTVYTAMGIISIVALICFIFVDPLVTLLGAAEESKPYAMEYARFILISAPFTAGEVTISRALRAEGSSTYSMIGMVGGCVINILLDPLFINVLSWGVAGAAIATTISKIISLGILCIPFVRKKTILELKPRYFSPSLNIYKEIARMGIPSFLRSSMMSVAAIVMNNVAVGFGVTALAAVSVAGKCTRLVGAGIMGFGQALQPIAGYCYGAKDYRRTWESYQKCSLIGIVSCIILGSIMIIAAPAMMKMFTTDDKSIITYGSLMIRSQCVTLFSFIWTMILDSLFLALGRPIESGIIGLSRQVICLIPALLIIPRIWGLDGLCVTQAAADLMAFALALPFAFKIKRDLRTMENEEKIQKVMVEN